jgi:hypothetical protein
MAQTFKYGSLKHFETLTLLCVIAVSLSACSKSFEPIESKTQDLSSTLGTGTEVIDPPSSPSASPTPAPSATPVASPSPRPSATPNPTATPVPQPTATPSQDIPANQVFNVGGSALNPSNANVYTTGLDGDETNHLTSSVASAASGWNVKSSALSLNHSSAFIEFTVNFTDAGTYLVVPKYYATTAAARKFAFYYDGVLTRSGDVPTHPATLNGVSVGGPASLITVTKGTHKLRYETQSNATFVIEEFLLVYPGQALPLFGKTHELSRGVVANLEVDALTSLYRASITGSTQAKKSMDCPWTYCFIEYTVNAPVAGTYNLNLKYSVYASEGNNAGLDIYIDDGKQGTLNIAGAGTSDAFAMTLPQGVHRIRIQINTKVSTNPFTISGVQITSP